MEIYREVKEASDVTEDILETVQDITEGFYLDCNFDWESFLRRLEEWRRIDLGGSMDSPAIRKIKKHAQKCKKDAQ